ncbi:oligoendopeptidase F [Bacillus pakistanensis]|uniref:Oligoendopeptidase F n=1 Tax=Rossellomorea pakistanensis TaxID=992288 RepID=A0ABS2NIB0_9BACI|nr:M3 family metallopeptidase [Bacillus pakistanensis]MBM7587553.1 oligoendopeptidase F [Bacillus pakistanensis]
MQDWKKAYNEEIEKLDLLYQEEERLYYEMYTGNKQSSRIDEITKIKHMLMTDEELIETLLSWRNTLINNKVWKRRLDVFLFKMKQEELDSHPEVVKIQQRLQSNLMDSKFTLNGKEFNLGTVHSNIMENPDRVLRKQLLLESKKIGKENEDLFRKLIQKRNKLAKNQGYSNYYHFRCSLKEINMNTYIKEMEKLLEQTEETSDYWDNRIVEKFGWEKIHLYDQYFSTFHFNTIQSNAFTANRLKEVLNDIVNSIGFPTDQLPVRIESLEIPYGGFCININPNDLRLVVNKRDSYSVFLSGIHEMGHVLDGHFSSYQYPELYRFYSSIAAEAIAELFQTIITDREFLKNNFDIQDDVYSQIREINHLTDIKMLKMNYYYSIVEFELYKNPERSFQEIANEYYPRVFGCDGETFHPASEMFYIENPAFFQDYNYAYAIRDMIREKFAVTSLYKKTDLFQELIKKFIRPNQLYSWDQRVERLCGEPHTFAYLAKKLAKVEF